MSKISQKEAVFNAIKNIFAEANVHFEEGMNVSESLTKEMRGQVNQILFDGFKAGTIELGKTYDDSKLKGYVSGLQSNYLRKDPRLNGNVSYVPKNPGSRTGSGDAQLKAMKALLVSGKVTNEDDIAQINELIEARTQEIQASKVKKVKIEVDALPEALKSKHFA